MPSFNRLLLVLAVCTVPSTVLAADATETAMVAILDARCVKCHGEMKPKGGVNLLQIGSAEKPDLRARVMQRALSAIESNDMPPEGEKPFTREEREAVTRWLKESLRKSTDVGDAAGTRLHRLTRVQYNNAVRDLFRLNRDVFDLPEKLITRRDRYIPSVTGKMPEKVNVAARAFQPDPGLAGVKPFPKDAQAEHGFDNQANKLALSPLLVDAFLRLSVSIVESPDFNPQTVGVWNDFFRDPGNSENRTAAITSRLKPFLRLAFRRPVEDETLHRYVAFAEAKIDKGASFTDAMKKVASAALCSPMFLCRSAAADGSDGEFELASRLSFFLWSSIPDAELLDLAEQGKLSDPAVLKRTVDRLMNDPKIERFLDAFPTQWLRLENLMGVAPDPKKSRYFRVDDAYPASLAMVAEPLLLFDAVFVENRPAIELIAPTFSYRNDFLRDWYESNLAPPTPDAKQVAARNKSIDEQRRQLEAKVAEMQGAIDAIEKPAREKWAADRKLELKREPVDLKPIAAWEFNGDLKDSIQGLDLKPNGKIRFEDGKVVLDHAFLQSGTLKADLKAKTLEVWCELPDVKQRGGGVMTIQGPGGLFDSIVLGERKPQHWISGSNNHARTDDFADSEPETKPGQRLHLVMVYAEDGTTKLYRNGEPYGKPYRKGSQIFARGESCVLFGLRHLPAGGNKYLSVTIDKARLYDRALTAAEVAAAASGSALDLSEQDLARLLPAAELTKLNALRERLKQARADLAKAPMPYDIGTLRRETEKQFEEQLRAKLRSTVYQRTPLTSPRYGGIITNAAMLSMTSGPLRTQPIARGTWIIEVIFNDPPPPPPNDVPPLKEEDNSNLTIREQFAAHRANPSCAGCHAKIDPLGFALENYDITGRWRDKYENGRPVDASGALFRKHSFTDASEFKAAIVAEKQRFARAFTTHLLRFALARELIPADSFTVDEILNRTGADDHKLQSLVREIAMASRRRATPGPGSADGR